MLERLTTMKCSVWLVFFLASLVAVQAANHSLVVARHVETVENDVCDKALPNFTLATKDDSEVLNDCYSDSPPVYPGLWYSVQGTGEQLVVRSCNVPTYVSIYQGGCGLTNLQCVVGTTYPCSSRLRLLLDTILDRTYYILHQNLYVYYYDIADLTISVAPPPPENDLCVNALPMAIGSTVYGNTTYATIEDLSALTGCYYPPQAPGIWYTLEGNGDPLVAQSCNSTSDADILVFKGSCSALEYVALFAHISLCGPQAFSFATEPGTTFYIMIQAEDSIVDLSIFVPPIVINDLCEDALSIAIGETVSVNATFASVAASEVPSYCYTSLFCTLEIPGVWYKFEGTGERLFARSCSSVSIYQGACGATNLQCVTGSDYACRHERLFLDTINGTTYYVLIQTNRITDLTIRVAPPSPANDLCVNAEPIAVGSTVYANTTYATSDAFDVLSNCTEGRSPFNNPGIWYTFNGTGDRLDVQSCDAMYYSSVTIYKGGCGATSLQCVTGSRSLCGRNRLIVDTEEGQTYHVLVQSDAFYDEIVDLSIFVAFVENDDCQNASSIEIGTTVYVNTTYARIDALDVPSNCFSGSDPVDPGVWYTFVGTGERMVARSCGSVQFLSIYKGLCGASTLECVAGGPGCGQERIIFDTVIGTTYHVLIQSVYDEIVDLAILVAPPPASNDFCVNAQPISIGSTVAGNATYATSDELDVQDDCGGLTPPINPGLWYTFVGTGTDVSLDTCLSTADATVSVYVGDCGPSTLQCVAVGNRLCGSNVLSFRADNMTRYLVLLQARSAGLLQLSVNNSTSPTPVPVPAPSPTLSPLPVPVPAPFSTLSPLSVPVPAPSSTLSPLSVPVPAPSSTLSPLSVPVPAPSSLSIAPVLLPTLSPVVLPSPAPAPQPAPIPSPIPSQPRPIVIAWIYGDPHITTMDGLEFDCQARGEFSLLKSLDSPFHIQSRFTKVSSPDISDATASVTSGLVIRESEQSPLIQVSLREGTADSIEGCFNLIQLYENRIERPLSSGASSSSVTISVLNDEIIIAFSGAGVEVHMYVKSSASFGCFFTHWIYLPDNYRSGERFVGLLGNVNGDPDDDWLTKEGGILPTPSTSEALFQGGYNYCREEWCVRSVSDSLFTYDVDESFALYFDCDAEYETGLEDAVENAPPELKNICGENVKCIIDGLVGTTSDAQVLLDDTARIEEEVENRIPPKPCGLFGWSIFCPCTFQGLLGRLIRRLFGF